MNEQEVENAGSDFGQNPIFNLNDVTSEMSSVKSERADDKDLEVVRHQTNELGSTEGLTPAYASYLSQQQRRKETDETKGSSEAIVTPEDSVRGFHSVGYAENECEKYASSSSGNGGCYGFSSSSSQNQNHLGNSASTEQGYISTKEPVKIEDALNYLDLVKLRFTHQPEIYNGFLEVMKEFKTLNIDTDCVINRVSQLFQGHPDLIDGFKVFLPHEHRSMDQILQPRHFGTVGAPEQYNYMSIVVHDRPVPAVISPGPVRPVSLHDYDGTLQNHQRICPQDRILNDSSHLQSASVSFPERPTTMPVSESSSNFYPGPHEALVGSTSLSYQQVPVPQLPIHHDRNFPAVEFGVSMNHVNFDQAINYVNRIKNRLQPEKYKQFLEILHGYRRQQRHRGTDCSPYPANAETENEIYEKISALFENQKDLLVEFLKYMPSSNTVYDSITCPLPSVNTNNSSIGNKNTKKRNTTKSSRGRGRTKASVTRNSNESAKTFSSHLNSSVFYRGHVEGSASLPPKKKSRPRKMKKTNKTVVTISDWMDRVRCVLSPYQYHQFLKAFEYYWQDILSRAELLQCANDLLRNESELMASLITFLDSDCAAALPESTNNRDQFDLHENEEDYRKLPCISELDHSNCRRLGHSYCRIPAAYQLSTKDSGGAQLFEDVLNNEWICVPSLMEGTAIAASKKTPTEEIIYRCEEERFECDFLIQTNAEAIKYLELALEKISRMTVAERDEFEFDDCMGSRSSIHLQAIKRIYGNDAAPEIIEGLKRRPSVAIPLVLKRLKAKGEEWRNTQKECNKLWNEQMAQHYLRSLDHQGPIFKQVDYKAIRPKSLIAEIQDGCKQNYENGTALLTTECANEHQTLTLPYTNLAVFNDACKLLMHLVRRQPGISVEDKQSLKRVVKQFLPELFQLPIIDFPEDKDDTPAKTDQEFGLPENIVTNNHPSSGVQQTFLQDQKDTIFYANQRWYVFLRLHNLLCNRLAELLEITTEIQRDTGTTSFKNSPAFCLGHIQITKVEKSYPAFLELVTELLDGAIESSDFEDQVRNRFGVQAYRVFTIDKVITQAIAQLQYFVSDEVTRKCVDVFYEVPKVSQSDSFLSNLHDLCYRNKAIAVLGNDFSVKVEIGKPSGLMKMELLHPAWLSRKTNGSQET